MHITDQARSQDSWILAKFSFCVFMDRDEVVLVYFRAMKRKPVIFKSDGAFRVSRFLVSSRQRNHRKFFLLSRKILFERKLSRSRLDLLGMHSLGEIVLRKQNEQSRTGSIDQSCPLG